VIHKDSSLSIVSDYRLEDKGSIPGRGKGFFSSLCIQDNSEAHSASYLLGTGGHFPRGKAWPGRGADHSPLSSADVKNKLELYSSPLNACMVSSGSALLYFIFLLSLCWSFFIKFDTGFEFYVM
jgi:hypothetical protein